MRIIIFIFLIGLLTGFDNKNNPGSNDQGEKYRSLNQRAFASGEKAKYLVHYGLIDAGYAELEIKDSKKNINGREVLHIIGTGKSRGMLDFFFHVDDRYETYIDKEGIFPWLFVRDIKEGGYKIKQRYEFHQNKNEVATQKGKTHNVPPDVQDMFSAAFYARTLDMRNLRVGDIISIPSFVDDEFFELKIRYGGTQEIKIKSGKYRCMKFNPVIQEGRIFNTAEDLEVWVSDDENKMPILCQAKILVGAVKVELVEYSGLSNPLAHLSK